MLYKVEQYRRKINVLLSTILSLRKTSLRRDRIVERTTLILRLGFSTLYNIIVAEPKGHNKWLTRHLLNCSFPIFLPPLSLIHFRCSVPNDEFSLGTQQRQCITETGGRKSGYEQLTRHMTRQDRTETKQQ